MKLNKYSVIAFGLSCAMFFAGCAFEGTKTNFKKNENNAYNAVYDQVKLPGNVIHNDVTIAKDAKAELSFVIISNGYLDEDTIKKGCNFYSVANNSVPEFMPSLGSAPVAKTLKDLTVQVKVDDAPITYGSWTIDFTSSPYNNYNGINNVCFTFLTYEVDTTQFNTNKVALVADAEILRENTKKYILNGNGNDECGEETDSIAPFYTLASGDSVSDWYDFAPEFGYSIDLFSFDYMTDDTARYVFKIKPLKYDKNSTPVYHESFANDLNSMYTLKYKELGSKKWQSTSVNFVYDPLDHGYKWQSDPIALGTQCYILYEVDNSITWDAAAEKYGGRAPRLGYGEDTESIFGLNTSYYYAAEPTYIVSDPTVANSFVKGEYPDYQVPPDDSIKKVQSGIVDYNFLNDGIIKISIKNTYQTAGIRFGAYDDIIITNRKNGKCGAELDSEILEDKTIRDSNGGITDIFVQLDNKYFDLGTKGSSENVMIWLGPGVTISGSKTAQTTFGSLGADRDSLYLAMPGYVCIN